MPHVQYGRAILYSLHRGARSRGLQAGRERELVPGLCVERRGLLETLISCSEERAYYRVLLVACTCVYLSDVSMSVCLFVLLGAAPVTPFYSRREVQERYMCLLRGALFGRGSMSEPCSLSLWRYGRWSGLVLGALE